MLRGGAGLLRIDANRDWWIVARAACASLAKIELQRSTQKELRSSIKRIKHPACADPEQKFVAYETFWKPLIYGRFLDFSGHRNWCHGEY
jgi:hypothetical protein